jgi:hypothetical protein
VVVTRVALKSCTRNILWPATRRSVANSLLQPVPSRFGPLPTARIRLILVASTANRDGNRSPVTPQAVHTAALRAKLSNAFHSRPAHPWGLAITLGWSERDHAMPLRREPINFLVDNTEVVGDLVAVDVPIPGTPFAQKTE